MNELLLSGLILLTLTVLVVTLGLARARRARRELRTRQLHGLQLIRLLKDLMGLVQVHRGLASLVLNGDAAKATELAARQQRIAAALGALQRHPAAALLTPARLARIQDYWGDIERGVHGFSPEQSFDQHSQLIRQILFLIGDTADHARLQELPGQDGLGATLWGELPAAAEAIGQARAVGAGVAAAGRCDSVARIKLRYLHQRLDAALASLTALPGATAACPPKVERLLDELEHKLLQPDTPATTATRYFGVASEALEAVYAVFEQATARLERRLAGEAA